MIVLALVVWAVFGLINRGRLKRGEAKLSRKAFWTTIGVIVAVQFAMAMSAGGY